MVLLLTAAGCYGAHLAKVRPHHLQFVPTPPAYRAQCRSTARAVHYPVPCPLRVPLALAAHQDGATAGCVITIICPGTGPWHGWAIGSTSSPTQHLVITASPLPLRNDAKLVDGPGWYPAARVRPLLWMTIDGRRMRAVLVPPGSESAFGDHVVLIWTVGQHTYGLGFHNFHGLKQALLLDKELAKYTTLVRP